MMTHLKKEKGEKKRIKYGNTPDRTKKTVRIIVVVYIPTHHIPPLHTHKTKLLITTPVACTHGALFVSCSGTRNGHVQRHYASRR